MSRHLIRGLGLAAVLVLVAVGCGDDGGGTPAIGETPTSGSAEVADLDPDAVPVVASDGCETVGATPEQGETEVSTTSGGDERTYFRFVPEGYDGESPMPLVLDFHGYSEGSQVHTIHSALGPFGDEQGFITVTPQGSGPIALWRIGFDKPDVRFVGDLLDELEADLCLDTNRVYVTGLSNGAFMTSAVACVYSDRVAAVAPVAGAWDLDDCALDRPVPVIAFHGTDDQFVSYDGGLGPAADDLPTADGSSTIGEDPSAEGVDDSEADNSLSVPETMAAWADRNGCESEPSENDVADDVTLLTFECRPDATTLLYQVNGGGHTWPGSEFSKQISGIVGKTTYSIDANELMWEFFQGHPLGLGAS